ncbi:hypothetical protein O7635_20560 [Asanoa sp. WMMD1127]|uniref:hypothetical protein n=1 Tax=Asanoa sp. WMMD1127 TaxID=3016107 RepID=UPI002416317E|nr:hypothetical protein [Asanoa sp. WMMD1127]MDG4824250.1 hypothetical protein [Asanoa sp. WMMD1127]
MRDDHTLENENGAATPADRSAETPTTERTTGARRLQERLARTAGSIKTSPYAERAAGMWTASRDRMTALPAYDKMRGVLNERGPARVAIAGGVLAAVGVAAAAGTAAATSGDHSDTRATSAAVAAVDSAKKAEISHFPTAPPVSGGDHSAAGQHAGGSKGADKPTPSVEKPQGERKAAHDKSEKKSEKRAEKKAAKSVRPTQPKPVMGLSQTQMNNAMQIVKAAEKRGMGERGAVIAVATSMQESQLLNLASTAVPESYDYHHEGQGSDHDSVGLFQQRSTSGWGSVKNLMNPSYSAGAFLDALKQVPNWDDMPLTAAAQTVQVSAFPDAYAQHEYRATQVVEALMK